MFSSHSHFPTWFFSKLSSVGESLIQPDASLLDPEARRRSRLLLAILLTLIVSGGIIILFEAFTNPGSWNDADYWLTVVVWLLGFGLYNLARRGHTNAAAATLIALLFALFSAAPFTPESLYSLPFYIVIPLFLTAVFFSFRTAVWVTILALVVPVVLSLFFPMGEVQRPLTIEILLFVLPTSSMILVHVNHRHAIERIHHIELQTAYERLRLSEAMLEERVEERTQELRSYEQALHQSEAHLRSLIESQTAFMIRSDMQGNYTYVNPSFATWYGQSPEALIGMSFTASMCPIDNDKTLTAVEACVAQPGKPVQLPLTKTVHDGTLRHTLWEFIAIQDQNNVVTEIQCMGFDITRQYELEEALRQSEERLRSILENMRDIVWSINLSNYEITYMNPSLEVITGRSVAEFVANPRLWYEITHPDDRSSTLQHSRRIILRDGHSKWEGRIIRPNGDIRWLMVRNWLVRNAQGQAIRIEGMAIDITERKLTETALRDQHAELDRFFTVALDLLCIADTDGNFIKVNRAWEDILGYPVEELQGRPFLDFVHPDDLQFTLDSLNALRAQQPIINFTSRYRARNNGYHFIEWRSYPVGKLIYAAARDITERRRSEEALRQSEERQRAIIEAIPDFIFRTGKDGTFLTCGLSGSPPLVALLANSIGKTVTDLLPEPVARQHMTAVQQVMRTRQLVQYEFETSFEEVAYRFEARIVPLGQNEVLSIVRDVTELWQVRRDLEIAKGRLEFSVDAARIAWWEMDVSSGELRFDDRKAQMAGYSRQDFNAGTYYAFTRLVHPDDYEPMMQAMRDLLDGRKPVYVADYRLRKANGDWIWFHDRGELITTDDGRLMVRGFAIDITERILAQQHEFDLALEKERLSLLRQFIEKASHEFRTPLSVINTNAFLMALATEPEKRQSRLMTIEKQVMRIARLVDMLLTMSKLESGVALEYAVVDLAGIFNAVCQNMVTYHGPKPQLNCEGPRNLPPLIGNADYLTDALKHLLDNAYRFTAVDGIITVSAGAENGYIWLAVQDTGPGIAKEDLPHIFETFWRQDEAHSTPGFGLGLPITQKIIQMHGGRIEVESQVNQGTLFRIILPCYSPVSLSDVNHMAPT